MNTRINNLIPLEVSEPEASKTELEFHVEKERSLVVLFVRKNRVRKGEGVKLSARLATDTDLPSVALNSESCFAESIFSLF